MRILMTRMKWTILLAASIASLLPSKAVAHPGSGIVIDRLGQIYFLDTGAGVWKIDRAGKLTRISSENLHWLTIDNDDALARVTLPSGSRGDVRRVGTGPTLLVASDYPLVMGGDRAMYYPLTDAAAGLQIMRLSSTGPAHVFATLPRSSAGSRLNHINGMAAGVDGSIYYAEDDAIRRITPTGGVSTVIERVRPDHCTAIPGNGQGSSFLRGLAVDSGGTVYVAASGCGSVLKIAPDGRVTTLVQTQSPWSPTAVALFGADLYVLEYLHTEVEVRSAWIPRIRRVSPDGTSRIIATVERR
jgi:hypothetical protein